MVQCIKAGVSQCTTTEAGELVDLLVRPSVQYSGHCPREGVSTTTTTTQVVVSVPLPTYNV